MTSDTSPVTSPATLSGDRQELLRRLLQRQAQQGAGERRAPAVSLFFFSADVDDHPADKYEVVLAAAELADEIGLDAVWVPERHFDRFGAPYPAPALLLAAIAARTSRIQLRAGSVVLPLHDPLLVAEEWGVLDAISNGRAGISLASGWHADDFVLAPEVYEHRKDVLREHLQTMRTLWSGEAVDRTGPDGRIVPVRTYPRPARPLPTWLTSSVNAASWQTAGALGVNVLTALLEQSVDAIAGKVALYRSALAAAGHTADGRQITCMLHTHLAPDPQTAVDRVREPLRRYLSAHLNLFTKFASTNDVGVRPEEVSAADRDLLLDHGVQRYVTTSGLFGSVGSCLPMVEKLTSAGVTELGCLVDFGLPREQVLESVAELGALRERLRHEAARR